MDVLFVNFEFFDHHGNAAKENYISLAHNHALFDDCLGQFLAIGAPRSALMLKTGLIGQYEARFAGKLLKQIGYVLNRLLLLCEVQLEVIDLVGVEGLLISNHSQGRDLSLVLGDLKCIPQRHIVLTIARHEASTSLLRVVNADAELTTGMSLHYFVVRLVWVNADGLPVDIEACLRHIKLMPIRIIFRHIISGHLDKMGWVRHRQLSIKNIFEFIGSFFDVLSHATLPVGF